MAGVCRGEPLWGGNRWQTVARDDRDEGHAVPVRREQRGDSAQHGLVAAEHAAEQRCPGEVDRQGLDRAAKHLRWVLGVRGDEQRVWQGGAARRSTRGDGHRRGICVDADDERVGPPRRRGQHRAAVSGAEVDHHLGVALCQTSEVIRIELVEASTTNHAKLAHDISSRGPGGFAAAEDTGPTT